MLAFQVSEHVIVIVSQYKFISTILTTSFPLLFTSSPLHAWCRHPCDMGGAAFSASMIWAQVMPFVALEMYEAGSDGVEKDKIMVFLICSFFTWLLINIKFFRTIDLSYLHTFFGFKTASQYTTELFLTSKLDKDKYRAAFKKRASYTKSVEPEIKAWVAENIEKWMAEREDWFKIQQIPEEFLPGELMRSQKMGMGSRRRRSSFTMVGNAIGIVQDDEGDVNKNNNNKNDNKNDNKNKVVPLGNE